MFWDRTEIKWLRDRLKDMQSTEQALKKAQSTIDDLLNKVNQQSSDEANATFVFDFDSVKVFSIERLKNKHGVVGTNIGYLLREEVVEDDSSKFTDTTHEWFMDCSLEQHERLVREFCQHKRQMK